MQSRNEDAFKSCCQKHFSSRSGGSLLNFPVNSGADAKASPRGTSSAAVPLSAAAVDALSSAGEKARDSPDAGAKADAEAMNWMVQSMSMVSEADAKGSAGESGSGHAGGFPVPRGRPVMRPPVAMHKAGVPTTNVASTSASHSSVAAHSMSGKR